MANNFECIICSEEFPNHSCVTCSDCGVRICYDCYGGMVSSGRTIKCPQCRSEEPLVKIGAKGRVEAIKKKMKVLEDEMKKLQKELEVYEPTKKKPSARVEPQNDGVTSPQVFWGTVVTDSQSPPPNPPPRFCEEETCRHRPWCMKSSLLTDGRTRWYPWCRTHAVQKFDGLTPDRIASRPDVVLC